MTGNEDNTGGPWAGPNGLPENLPPPEEPDARQPQARKLTDAEYMRRRELSDAEYQDRKNKEDAQKAQIDAEYKARRRTEDQLIFRLRFDAAKGAAAEMAGNSGMEPESIVERAFAIADALVARSGLLGVEAQNRHKAMFLRPGQEVQTGGGAGPLVITRPGTP